MTSILPRVSIHVSPKPPAPVGHFAYVLHDREPYAILEQSEYYREDWGYCVPRGLLEDDDKLKNDRGWPEMVPLEPRTGVKLDERLQWFWMKQLVLSKYGISLIEPMSGSRLVTIKEQFLQLPQWQRDYMLNAWRGITKGETAFMNGKGTDHNRDFIRGENEDGEFPQLFENLCGGATIELYSRFPYGRGYKVKTLRVADYETWKHWTYQDHPQYFFAGKNATPYLVGTVDTFTEVGPWKVDDMHYLDGKPVIVPILSAGDEYVKVNRVRLL